MIQIKKQQNFEFCAEVNEKTFSTILNLTRI